jgi:uncharacterized membrane protein
MLFNLTNENDLENCFMVMPNRAMLWQHIMMIYLLISGVTISIAFGFFTQGLTLILPFAGLELLALGVVLYISAWRSNIKEVVNVTEEKIRIEIGRNAPEKTYELDKAWAKVVLERSWNNWYPSRLLLRSHGRQFEIGKFLNEQERQCLEVELKKVINN